jgi:hypothetical protein
MVDDLTRADCEPSMKNKMNFGTKKARCSIEPD